MFGKILENVKDNAPLVHSITNYVTVNDCANIVLACGGSPIMADDRNEVEEITAICNALVINIGTLNGRTIESMIKAGKKSNELNHPVILDPVGAGASTLRTETALKLLREVEFSVIRGNISEIKTIYQGSGTTKGVDAQVEDVTSENNIDDVIFMAKDLSQRTGAVVTITGAIDIVANSKKVYIIRNGNALMSKITGTGCMLSAVIGSFCGANKENILEATTAAVGTMGVCGDLAYERLQEIQGGTSTYRMLIIDYMSTINHEILDRRLKIESR